MSFILTFHIVSSTYHLYLGFEFPIKRWLRICGVCRMEAALLLLRSKSRLIDIVRPPLALSLSSSSSLMLPRRSLLRTVDGRRVSREGRCCPRVDRAVEVSPTSGRKSFELARRDRLDERGIGDGDCGRGVAEWFVIAISNSPR
jgi:hypothetical protein